MIDKDKKYTYKSRPVRIYADGSDTRCHNIHIAFLEKDEWVSLSVRKSDLVEVWQPVYGELIYCWNKGAKYPNIRRFVRMSCNGIFLCISRDGSKEHDRNGYSYCAPFNGILPEAFKGL